MAKTPQTDEPKKKKMKPANLLVWAILVLVMLGLGGFGVTNFGGGITTIARVGDRDITTNDYARALRQEMDAISAQLPPSITRPSARASPPAMPPSPPNSPPFRRSRAPLAPLTATPIVSRWSATT